MLRLAAFPVFCAGLFFVGTTLDVTHDVLAGQYNLMTIAVGLIQFCGVLFTAFIGLRLLWKGNKFFDFME